MCTMRLLLSIALLALICHARRISISSLQPTNSQVKSLAGNLWAEQPSVAGIGTNHHLGARTQTAPNHAIVRRHRARTGAHNTMSADRGALLEEFDAGSFTKRSCRSCRSLVELPYMSSRRSMVLGVSVSLLARAPVANSAEPSEEAVLAAKNAFKAFDERNLPLADELFSQTINEWRLLDRNVELTSLLVARAGVRTDRKLFKEAEEDLNEAIALMEPTGENKTNGIARYREYPDAFVQRGLAREGLRDWRGAVSDYDRAVKLWGSTGDGVNPFVLNYRGRARSETGDFEGALDDFRESANLFARVDKNVDGMSTARANEAVTLYGIGRRDEAVKLAKKVITRMPGYTDMHVMLAADAWDRGDKEKAEYEWNFACELISTSCGKYRDIGWLTEVRRWPPKLVELQKTFLANRLNR